MDAKVINRPSYAVEVNGEIVFEADSELMAHTFLEGFHIGVVHFADPESPKFVPGPETPRQHTRVWVGGADLSSDARSTLEPTPIITTQSTEGADD